MRAPFHIFDLFAGMLTDVPARKVMDELDLEGKMLEQNVWRCRLPLTREAFSILRFCKFVRAAKTGGDMCFVEAVSPDHLEFYKTTIVRLFQANELPLSATNQFDHVFVTAV